MGFRIEELGFGGSDLSADLEVVFLHRIVLHVDLAKPARARAPESELRLRAQTRAGREGMQTLKPSRRTKEPQMVSAAALVHPASAIERCAWCSRSASEPRVHGAALRRPGGGRGARLADTAR